jgi:hypothetical protein
LYSKIYVEKIASAGGFFTTEMLLEEHRKSFLEYLRKHNLAEVISVRRRAEIGYLFKLRDELIEPHYHFDGRQKIELFTYNGHQEFNKRVREHIKKNGLVNRYDRHVNKDWYKEIEHEIKSNPEYFTYTRYKITDYKLFQCFTRFLLWSDKGYSVYSRKEMDKYCPEFLRNGKVTPGVSYCKIHSENSFVVLISDFSKSLSTLTLELAKAGQDGFFVYIYTFHKPEDLYGWIKREREKEKWEGYKMPFYNISNNQFLNRFFGEW